jgi:hypothetical protein
MQEQEVAELAAKVQMVLMAAATHITHAYMGEQQHITQTANNQWIDQ